MIILHAAISIALIVLLIIKGKVDPIISLMVGSLYMGIAGGLGLVATVSTIGEGFGGLMIDVGLLIGFGVLIGALLNSLGALEKTVQFLFRLSGRRKLPYVMAVVLNLLFPSIYPDVQLVLAAPLARSSAQKLGQNGIGIMAGALVVGIPVGVVFVVPGLGSVSIAGLLGIPLGTMLLCGAIVAPLVSISTLFIYSVLVKRGWWNVEKDEETSVALETEEKIGQEVADKYSDKLPRLWVSILSVVIPIVLVGGGAIARTFGVDSEFINFISEPIFALFIGLVYAYILARVTIGAKMTGASVQSGLDTTGNILLITGLGGSLAAVIKATSLGDVLKELFAAEAGMNALMAILLAWVVAVVLHVAIGSINVAAIAAAGIIGPVVGGLGVTPLAIAVAIASGALFAVHFNSNFFWMFQSLLGVTTRGALKSMTFLTSLASVMGLIVACALAVVS